MKKIILLIIVLQSFCLSAQITFNGCHGIFDDQDYVFANVGTDATGRNIYETTPIDGNQSCSGIGSCEFRISWNATNNRWEFIADDGNGDFSGIFLIYSNTEASLPNPPSLTLGVWAVNSAITGGECGGDLTDANSTLTGDVQSALPLALLSFNAVSKDKKITLNWVTSQEFNVDRFDIERSYNLKSFNKIGEVKEKKSGNITEYSFYDYNEINQLVYYRLKIIDVDGTFEYSKIVSSESENANSVVSLVFPNPYKKGVSSLEVYSALDTKWELSYYTNNGLLKIRNIAELNKGKNTLILNSEGISRGKNFIRLVNTTTQEKFTRVVLN